MANVQTFLDQAKKKAETKAAEMAKLELSVWNSNHTSELKNHFGFSDKALAERKTNLLKLAK
jgi:hypothetical protein